MSKGLPMQEMILSSEVKQVMFTRDLIKYAFISTISLVLLTLYVLLYTRCSKKWLDCLLSQSEQRYKYWIKRTCVVWKLFICDFLEINIMLFWNICISDAPDSVSLLSFPWIVIK
jgi:hypothetical protein